ncbi:MAG TPA: helix-turn-helix transcriptional regulator [Desulfomicrobiaceae bacterium]|nr:helix-turn-helix transcriptional regulator [Desulfomicrobiaceae bacterium]
MDDNTLFEASEVFPKSHLGTILRGFRTREGLTQKELARMTGLKPHHVSEMETGKRLTGKEIAERLAGALDVDQRFFL